jgi:hypothetical protein
MSSTLRKIVFGFGLLAVAVMGTGCEEAKTKASAAAKGAEDLKKNVGEDLKKGVDVAKDAIAKAKEAFAGPIKELLGKAEGDIKALEDKANAKDTAADVKASLLEKAGKAKELLPKIKEKLAAVMSAEGDKWEAAKAEIEKLVTELKGYLVSK